MKVFFDTNVYVAEALGGEAAEALVRATTKACWRIFTSPRVVREIEEVLKTLGESSRFAMLTRQRVEARAAVVEPGALRRIASLDEADASILQAALEAGADYLVTNDAELLALNPFKGLRILSMTEYFRLLEAEGLLSSGHRPHGV